jgi:radial spoke head protein 4/6
LSSVWLALKKLVDSGHFEKLRFWGKIFGTNKNYYIAEAQQNGDAEIDDEEDNEENNEKEDEKDDADEQEDGEEDPLPKSSYKPPPIVPKEERGTGVNKYTYYVCNYRRLVCRLLCH